VHINKRLEKGVFRYPEPSEAEATGVPVKATDPIMLLDGIDLQSVERRPRYVRDSAYFSTFSGSSPWSNACWRIKYCNELHRDLSP
jgi:hypothetical protein